MDGTQRKSERLAEKHRRAVRRSHEISVGEALDTDTHELYSNHAKLCSSSLGLMSSSALRLGAVPDPEIPTHLSSRFIVNVDLVLDVSWVRCDGYVWSCVISWHSWWCSMTVWVMTSSHHVLVWVITMSCVCYMTCLCEMWHVIMWDIGDTWVNCETLVTLELGWVWYLGHVMWVCVVVCDGRLVRTSIPWLRGWNVGYHYTGGVKY